MLSFSTLVTKKYYDGLHISVKFQFIIFKEQMKQYCLKKKEYWKTNFFCEKL